MPTTNRSCWRSNNPNRNDRIAEVVERRIVDRNQHMLSAQKCDDRHRDNRDLQGIVPDALPANRAFEFGIMGLHILNDRVNLSVDQPELLGQCRSEIGWFCRLHGFGARLHSLARQLYCKLHPIHRR
jgi:hypothetical protein